MAGEKGMHKTGGIVKGEDAAVGVRLTREEYDAFRKWCDETGIGAGVVLRQVIRLVVGMKSALPALVEVHRTIEERKK